VPAFLIFHIIYSKFEEFNFGSTN